MYIHDATLFSSASRTATTSTTNANISGAIGAHLLINVSAGTTGGITPKIEGYDPVSATYYNLLTGTAITSTGHTVLRVGIGLESAANTIANEYLPEDVKVTVTHATTGAYTYTIVLRKFFATAKR